MSTATNRARYRSAKTASWATFLPLALFTFCLALLLAAGMNWLFYKGWYLLILVPALAAGFLAGVVNISVAMGKCRFPLVAGLFGFLTGVLLYGGYLYFGMLTMLGSQGITRFDLLPNYISLRLHTQTHHDIEQPSSTPERPDVVGNSITFSIEAGLVLFLTTTFAYGRSKRAFCEKCDDWKKQSVVTFPPGCAKQIAQWFDQGELRNVASLPFYVPKGKRKRSTMLALESCNVRAGGNCPVFMAVKEVLAGGGLTAFDGARGKLTVRRAELSPDEVSSIAPVFSHLTDRFSPKPPTSAVALKGTPVIDVQPIPPGEANQVLTTRSKVIGNVLSLLVLPFFWGSIAGAIGGMYQIGESTRQQPVDYPRVVMWIGVALFCAVAAGFSGFIGLKNSGVTGNLYYRWLSRRSIAVRRNKWVDPDRPGDLPVLFVQIVPRKNWGTMMLETATDTGFLQIDPRKREIRFEGDVDRYRIPAAAITSCSIAGYSSSAGKTSIEYWVVVIQGNTAKGPWEAPISLRQTRWFVAPDHRKQSAQMILDRITPLLSIPAANDAGEVIPSVAAFASNGPAVTPPTIPKSVGALRSSLPRLVVISLAIGVGIWRGISNDHDRPSDHSLQNVESMLEKRSSTAPRLELNISNIRPNQHLTDAEPFYTSGGSWTVFDCGTETDPSATFTVAVETPKLAGKQLMSFAKAAILPGDRDGGSRLIEALAQVLKHDAPPPQTPQPLRPYKLSTAVLGQNLSSPTEGLKSDLGTWIATKWFLQKDGLEAEIYFDYDLSTNRAELTEKDPDYDADALVAIASAVRDGPRPPRSPLTDPGFTDIGPTVVDLQAIPDSAKCSCTFARGGQLLTMIRQGSPSIATGIALQDPKQKFTLSQCDGMIANVVCIDPQAKQLIVGERKGISESIFNANDEQLIWLVDRTTGTRRQLTGPWEHHGWIDGDRSLSPDNRYLAISGLSGTILDQKRTLMLYLLNIQTGKSVQVKMEDCSLMGWRATGNQMRALLASGNAWDQQPDSKRILADPDTGEISGDNPPGQAPNVSPDGRWSFNLHPGSSLDLADLSNGHQSTFTFHPSDKRFAQPGSLEWLDSRYIQFTAVRPCFIDVTTLKLGYLPAAGSPDEPSSFRFSPDFHWAIASDQDRTMLGRIVTAATSALH